MMVQDIHQESPENVKFPTEIESPGKYEQDEIQKDENSDEDLPQPNEEEDEDEDYDIKFMPQYHNKHVSNMKVTEQIIGNDGKIQRVYENGKKEVIFNNGVKREVFPDSYTIVYFNNNDIKQTYPDQKVVYYFAEAKTTQTTFPMVSRFSSLQTIRSRSISQTVQKK